jgi:uncharacterized protein (TIGR04255 family)
MTSAKPKTTFETPFGGPPPAERPLARAPLERVIAQVKFPTILKIEERAAVSNFQEKIRREYPVLHELHNQTVRIEMGLSGPITTPITNLVWQFADAAGDWKVSLARDAMTIETTVYCSRGDLMSRWVNLLRAVEDEFQPELVERIGLRFIDRIVGNEFPVFPTLMNVDLVNKATAMFRDRIKHSLSETLLEVEEGNLLLRWGVMAPNMSPDPSAIGLLAQESFLLDIDVWSLGQTAFRVAFLSKAFQKLAERAYSVFRFAVTEEFLRTYEAKS